ncbi:protein kinase family protein [Mycoplasmopsis canis]|uniref:class III lanthionine synthetase LanKC N-terminal domain-containing protein n=1 Tax=Mycoplasmopsis canis TaxID=29555 RepID=UPI00101BD6B1|nr:protein kinase family protein [Mycoplasmopsis canis]
MTGKFITIYPENEKKSFFIISQLFNLLKTFKGPITYSDRRYKKSIISYRYGHFLKLDKISEKFIIKKYKPDNIKDPFQKEQKISNSIKGFSILGLISFDAFSNIWLVSDKKNKYVMKESKKFFLDNIPVNNRKNEYSISSKFISRFIPKAIFKFWNDNSFFFLFEFKEGISLNKVKNLFNIFLNKDNSNEDLIFSFLNEFKLFIDFIHNDKKIILNDVKLDNFIFDTENKKISFIDLENSFLLGSKKITKVKSEYDNHFKNHIKNDKEKVFLMLLDIFFDFNKGSKISWQNYINILFSVKYNEFYFKILNYILQIFDKKIKLDKIKLITNFEYLNSKLVKMSSKIKYTKWSEIIYLISKDLNKNNFLFFDTLELILKCNDLHIGEELIRELLNIHEKKIDINGAYFNGQNYSYYLLNGTIGILYIVILFSVRFASNKFKYILDKYFNHIKDVYTRKNTIGLGMSGIYLVEYFYYKLFYGLNSINDEKLYIFLLGFNKNKFYDFKGKELFNDLINGSLGLSILFKINNDEKKGVINEKILF